MKKIKTTHTETKGGTICRTPIKAGCPEFICKKCGNPKILEEDETTIQNNVLEIVREFNHISISDIYDILEHLQDRKFLNDAGEEFRAAIWKAFIN